MQEQPCSSHSVLQTPLELQTCFCCSGGQRACRQIPAWQKKFLGHRQSDSHVEQFSPTLKSHTLLPHTSTVPSDLHTPSLQVLPLPHAQSEGHVSQFSSLSQVLLPQLLDFWQTPLWHRCPAGHAQSAAQLAHVSEGFSHVPFPHDALFDWHVPLLHVSPLGHAQSCRQVEQFSPCDGSQVPLPQEAGWHWFWLHFWPAGHAQSLGQEEQFSDGSQV